MHEVGEFAIYGYDYDYGYNSILARSWLCLLLGVDYYPEHWPEERWETDARLMREAGLTIVRLAEFAWCRLEPVEGCYDFGWLDDAIGVLARHGISVVLGTPTATPPAWMIERHRDILPLDSHQRVREFGTRLHRCLLNPKMREYSRSITRAMANHFGTNESVIGWQTDNEFEGNICYCDCCAEGFKEWLKARYGDLTSLNKAWGTVFWSQEYSAWSQVPLPLEARCGRLAHNPSLLLDYQRFASDTTVAFQKEQIDILRQVAPNQFITHNFMGMHSSMDYFDLAEDLDFISWDNYPGGGDTFDKPASSSNNLAHDCMRGLKGSSKPFWIMEQRSGPMGWNTMSPTTRPGEIRMWTWQSVAHGADAVVYFRWRSCLYGTEQYWHGVINHDGIARRRYREVAQIGREFASIGSRIDGTRTASKVAIVNSYDNIWAYDIQQQSFGLNYWLAPKSLYDAFRRQGTDVDIIPNGADFSQYKVVVALSQYLISPETAQRLEDYVRAGGILVTGYRSGVKDMNNACVDAPLPGVLRRCCGIEVEEYDAIGEGRSVCISTAWGSNHVASVWCDALNLEGAEVLAEYTEGFLAGVPAITVNALGSGKAYYLGTQPDGGFFTAFARHLAVEGGVPIYEGLPADVELASRHGDGRRLLFFINYNRHEVRIPIPRGAEVLMGADEGNAVEVSEDSSIALGPHGVAIVELSA